MSSGLSAIRLRRLHDVMAGQVGFPTLSKPYLDFWTGAYQAIDD